MAEFRVTLDADGSFSYTKVVIGGTKARLMSGKPQFPEFSENYVFEPNVRVLVVSQWKRTGAFPLK